MSSEVHKRHAPPPQDMPRDLESVYRAHARTVARWAGHLGGPSFDVEEVVQQVFLTVQRLLPGYRGEAEITTWLYRITANAVRHQRRKDRLRRWLAGTAEDYTANIPSSRPTPVEELERHQSTALVYRALDGLNDKLRTALILFELEKLDGETIARLMETRPATVRVWVHRARLQLAERIRKIERDELRRIERSAARTPAKGREEKDHD